MDPHQGHLVPAKCWRNRGFHPWKSTLMKIPPRAWRRSNPYPQIFCLRTPLFVVPNILQEVLYVVLECESSIADKIASSFCWETIGHIFHPYTFHPEILHPKILLTHIFHPYIFHPETLHPETRIAQIFHPEIFLTHIFHSYIFHPEIFTQKFSL